MLLLLRPAGLAGVGCNFNIVVATLNCGIRVRLVASLLLLLRLLLLLHCCCRAEMAAPDSSLQVLIRVWSQERVYISLFNSW